MKDKGEIKISMEDLIRASARACAKDEVLKEIIVSAPEILLLVPHLIDCTWHELIKEGKK